MMLGLDPEDCENKDKIQEFLQKISDEFYHMLISEFPDESLIVMRRKLCWEISDIFYLPLNVKNYSYKDEQNNDDIWGNKIRRWSIVDFKFHSEFNETLWREISGYGPSFWKEVDFFKAQSRRIYKFCSQILRLIIKHSTRARIMLQSKEHIIIPSSPWGGEYRIDHVWCLMSKMNLNTYKNIIRVKQYPELCEQISTSDDGGKNLSLNKFKKLRNETLVNPLFCSKILTQDFNSYQVSVEILLKHRVYTTGF